MTSMREGVKRLLRNRVVNHVLNGVLPNRYFFSQPGFCPCCLQATEFLAYHPSLRDNFRCSACGSIPRQRALLHVLESEYANWSEQAIHESSPSEGGASAAIQRRCNRYVSSHYYPDQAFGTMVFGHRNENLEAMTFPQSSFDVVITQDVLEHIYDPAAVFREIARTLKPGGAHIFTVPLVNKHRPTQVWAVMNDDGSPQFLHEPDYHANPIDPRGSAVTMRWGYDIVDFIKNACGLDTRIESIDDLRIGVRAEYMEVLVTRKPAG